MSNPNDLTARCLFRFNVNDGLNGQSLLARSYATEIAPTFARAATKYIIDQNGMPVPIAASVVPVSMLGGEKVVLIERAATQLVANPQTPSGFSNFGTPVITTGQTGPFGATAILIEDDDAAAREGKQVAVTFPADGTQVALFCVRKGTAAVIVVGIRDVTAGNVDRHAVTITWGATAETLPTLATQAGAGTIHTPYLVRDAAGQAWWMVPISAAGVVAANSNIVMAIADPTTTVGTFYLAGINAWNSSTPFSWQASAGTRAADAVSWAVPGLVPLPMSIYIRGREAGLYFHDGVNRRALQVGASNPATTPNLGLGKGTAGLPFAQYQDGVTAVSSQAAFSGTAVFGDLVEHRIVLRDDGTVISASSLNGGPEAVAAASSAATAWPAAFAGAAFHLGGGLSSNPGSFGYTHLAFAFGSKTQAELRELAGVS